MSVNSKYIRMPGDAAAMKRQYQKYLDLEIANNQRHMNASLLYRVQGQPSVQPKSYQTLTEKLADETKLRVTLRQELLQLTDDVNAGQIVEIAQPLQLAYIAQNMPGLVKFFSRTHYLGVPSAIFMDKIREDVADVQQNQMRRVGIPNGWESSGSSSSRRHNSRRASHRLS